MAPQLPYADFGKRLLAYLIDSVIVSAAFMILFVIVLLMVGGGALFSGNENIGDFAAALAGFGIFLFVLLFIGTIVGVWLYFAKMESSPSQATIGKRTMGIYVTDLQGQRLSFGRATGRYFSKIITNMIPLFIGWIMAAFTEKKQALHDMIAGTLVLRRG
ncbi:MAG TPA: RDD family protein [Methylomirabilota bacterium]|nr:RDD family protein [Methylomirabilota bacterium]